MLYKGKSHDCPDGYFAIKFYEGRKTKYENVGRDLQRAEARLRDFTKRRESSILFERTGIKTPGYDPLPVRSKSIAELRETFLDKYACGSEDTIAMYNVVVAQFVDIVLAGPYQGEEIKPGLSKPGRKLFAPQITEHDVIRYDRWMERQGRAKSTRANRYTLVRTFLRHCGIDPNKLIDERTNHRLALVPKLEVKTYQGDQIERLIAASSPYAALSWECFWKLGFRDEELAFWEWTDIDWEKRVASVRFKKPGSFPWDPDLKFVSKDCEERNVPIPPSLFEKLKVSHEKNPNTRFVLGTKNDRPNTKWLKSLKAYWRRAGLNCGTCKGCLERHECGQALLKTFRSTYLTTMLDHTNSRNVQKLAGHSRLETTERYLRPASTKDL